MMIKKGERVVVNGWRTGEHFIDEAGVVIGSDSTDYLVQFDKSRPMFHNGKVGGFSGKSGHCFFVEHDMVDVAKSVQPKITISYDNTVTTATLFDTDDSVAETGIATCNPSDKFDFVFGAKLAMERMYDKMKFEAPEVPKKGQLYCRVIRKYFSFDVVGNILKVNHIKANVACAFYEDNKDLTDKISDGIGWNYRIGEYVEMLKLVKRSAVVGDSILVTKTSPYSNNKYKVGDIVEVVEVDGNDVMFGGGTLWETLNSDDDYLVFESAKKVVPVPKPEPKKEPEYGTTPNFKMICTDNGGNATLYAQDKVYEVKNGRFINEYGDSFPSFRISSFDDWNNWTVSKFKLVPMETPVWMQVKEVDRIAKVGEYIKVLSEDGHGKKSGSIHKVVKMYDFNFGWILVGKENTGCCLRREQYVVLENYNPEAELPKKPVTERRNAEVGETILIVNANKASSDLYKNGDTFVVTVEKSCGCKVFIDGEDRCVCNREYEVIIK